MSQIKITDILHHIVRGGRTSIFVGLAVFMIGLAVINGFKALNPQNEEEPEQAQYIEPECWYLSRGIEMCRTLEEEE